MTAQQKNSRTFGAISWNGGTRMWHVSELEAHVAIRMKALFPGIPKQRPAPFSIPTTDETELDLEWFLARYPLRMSPFDAERVAEQAEAYRKKQARAEEIFTDGYVPVARKLNGELRPYQAKFVDLWLECGRILNGDQVGLGKTIEAIGGFTDPSTLPALVVCQTHLMHQWAAQVVRFLSLKPHIIKGNTPYPLPRADVYITAYSRLTGWVDVFKEKPFKSVVFDEAQELRRRESAKWEAAHSISIGAKRVLGLSGTPVYNYGPEVYNVIDVIKPGSLGAIEDFSREWCQYSKLVKDPKALGAHLRDRHLFIRRTRADVGKELPTINRIVHTVSHDEEAYDRVEQVARSLAIRATTGSFTDRGQASRELDIMMRMATGMAKAQFVAEYVRIILEGGEPVLLVGWHRDVYDVWREKLKDFNPVLYTGTESPVQKEAAKRAFVNGESDLMIMSLRSGVGLDGLQSRCKIAVFGELDWSPKVHEQVVGRIDRDGQEHQVTSIYLVSDAGSDPPMVEMLGLKAAQADGIVDPFSASVMPTTDDSRIKALAASVLKRRQSAVGMRSIGGASE